MRRARAALLALALAAPCAVSAYSISGQELLEWCDEGSELQFACVAYLSGLQDTVEALRTGDVEGARAESSVAHLFCIPPDTDGRELIRTFVEYARNNRPFLARGASTLALTAFVNSWPCP